MTQDALRKALEKGTLENLTLPAAMREQVLNNPMLNVTLEKLQAAAGTQRGKEIGAVRFSAFRRFDTDGDRKELENAYFDRRCRLVIFGLMSWLYGRQEDIAELEDVMWAICDEYTWCLAAHLGGKSLTRLETEGFTIDLFAAETAQTLAELLFLLKEQLHPLVAERVRQVVRERVICRFLEEHSSWENNTSNWAAVCGGAVGMAAIYLAESQQELCQVLERLEQPFTGYLQGFASDGTCLEGMDYWTYGFSYYVAFADLLFRRTGGEIDMLKPALVQEIARFQPKCFFPYGQNVSFSDAHNGSFYYSGLLCYLRNRIENVQMPDASRRITDVCDECGRWAMALRNLLWTEPTAIVPTSGGCYPLKAAQWYICTTDNGRVSLAAKAGHNMESHNHNDVGSFHLYVQGAPMLLDLGAGKYTRQYFSSQYRYENLCCCSRGHNLPIVDGQYQKEGQQYCAENVDVDETGMRADIARAYGNAHLLHFIRDLRFDRQTGSLTLRETYEFADSPGSIVERFIVKDIPQLEPGSITIQADGQTALLHYPSELFAASVTAAKHEQTTVYLLDLTLKQPNTAGEYLLRFDIP